jgi:hypothetical protein
MWKYYRNISLQNLRHTYVQMILRPYSKFVNKLTISQIMYLLFQDFETRVIRSAKPDHLEVRVWRNKIRFSQLMYLKFRAV